MSSVRPRASIVAVVTELPGGLGAVSIGLDVEDKVSGTSLIQYLRRDGIPVEPIKRTRDKRLRANDVTPSMASGYIQVPKFQDWYADYEAELLSFPKGTHDDQVDPTIDALTYMCGTGKRLVDMY